MATATVLSRLSLIPNLSSIPKSFSNKRTTPTAVSVRAQASFSDPFRIRDSSAESLLSTPWPSRRDEPFRFTDTSFIRYSQIEPVSTQQRNSEILDNLTETHFPNAVIIDGFVSNLTIGPSDLPDGVYFGSFSGLPDELVNRVSEFIGDFDSGDLFWSINGMGAPDLTVIYVPAGCKVENSIHLRYFSEEGGEVGVVEEFVSKDEQGFYWTNPVLEVVVLKNAKVKHSYLQKESTAAAHIKWTFVRQVLFLSLW
ncbi:hypothetical protein Bca52824_065318 [Brassica carinata]|uniref:Uncharacterized protein n=1 Tax=Brassica carinata TaxID=52824 RepID=A0A8X7QJH7_BRACI|nr:hypothetical protein Bca52824_065318 [Brassica carinata]